MKDNSNIYIVAAVISFVGMVLSTTALAAYLVAAII